MIDAGTQNYLTSHYKAKPIKNLKEISMSMYTKKKKNEIKACAYFKQC